MHDQVRRRAMLISAHASWSVSVSPPLAGKEAERCRPCRDTCGRVRRGAALLPDTGRPVPEGPGRQDHRLARRDQQDRDWGAAARPAILPRSLLKKLAGYGIFSGPVFEDQG